MKIKDIAFRTDSGLVRSTNEDYVFVDTESQLFIIADGIGGNIGGEVASRTAVKIIYGLLRERLNDKRKIEKDEIQGYINDTNRFVYETGIKESLAGMGTTLIVGYIMGDILHIIHAGDSRVYLIRNYSIIQLTHDHSVVEELVRKKLITAEEAREHHLRHIVTKTIGSRENIIPDILEVVLKKDDVILFCTDGLNEMLKDEQILNLVVKNKSANQICDDLIAYSNIEGGRDNISTIIIQL